MPVNGECMCGAVQVTVPDQPRDRSSIYCHCSNCKKQSGASGTYVMVVPEDEAEIKGKTKIYEDHKADSGTLLNRVFCENCGCLIYSQTEKAPGCLLLKMGLFDKIPKPTTEIYTKNRQSWEPAVEGITQIHAAS